MPSRAGGGPCPLPDDAAAALAHLDGENEDLRLDDVNEHLESCERCRQELDDIREIRRRYLALIPPAPDAELLERTELALTAIAFWSARPVIAFSRKRIAVAAVAVAALAVFGASAALFAPSGGTQRADLPAVCPAPCAQPAAGAAPRAFDRRNSPEEREAEDSAGESQARSRSESSADGDRP